MSRKASSASVFHRSRAPEPKEPAKVFQCEFPAFEGVPQSEDSGRRRSPGGRSRIMRFQPDYHWRGGLSRRYKPEPGAWQGIRREELVGALGDPTNFHLRYFEIQPGGFSTLEKHRHAHAVTAIRGEGRVLIGKRTYKLSFLDTAYIAPQTPHQLRNDGEEPFGFFCTVDAVRDRPQPISRKS